jgi:hypothetical protein
MRQDGDDEETLQFRRALEELRVLPSIPADLAAFEYSVESFDDALRLYFRREEVRIYNHRRGGASATANSLSSRSSLHIQVGVQKGQTMTKQMDWIPSFASVWARGYMLTDSIWVENGLVNGSMGTVRDAVWNKGQDPTKDMPTAIMIEVDDYDGPKFPGTNYVSILPVTRRFEYQKRLFAHHLPSAPCLCYHGTQSTRIEVETSRLEPRAEGSFPRIVICCHISS